MLVSEPCWHPSCSLNDPRVSVPPHLHSAGPPTEEGGSGGLVGRSGMMVGDTEIVSSGCQNKSAGFHSVFFGISNTMSA